MTYIPQTASGLGGAIIALGEKLASQVPVTFDGINFRWNGTTNRFEISTITGTRVVEWTNSTNYGTQSTVINGGAGIDGTFQGSPITITTTYQIIGDPGIVDVEHRVYDLRDNTNNKHYEITAIRKGTTTTDGWYSVKVELMGITGSTPITAGNGVQIVGNSVSLTDKDTFSAYNVTGSRNGLIGKTVLTFTNKANAKYLITYIASNRATTPGVSHYIRLDNNGSQIASLNKYHNTANEHTEYAGSFTFQSGPTAISNVLSIKTSGTSDVNDYCTITVIEI